MKGAEGMKRLVCLLMCIVLLFAGSGAFALYWNPIPLYYEPPYDPSSGILSGTIIWSDISPDDSGNNRLHYVNLGTGNSGQIDLDGYYYLVYSDLPGAVAAREADGKIFLYQVNPDGSLTPILEMDLPTTSYADHVFKYPATVYAYYDGWIYYNTSESYDHPTEDHSEYISLVRVKPDENKLFAYRKMPAEPDFALSPDGKLAWFEDSVDGREAVTLIIQNPKDGSVVEIPFPRNGEIHPVSAQPVWRNEDVLVFCDIHGDGEKQVFPLYAYHPSSGEISPMKRKNGSHIILPYAFERHVQLNRDESQLYVGSVWGYAWFCVVDISAEKYYRIEPNPSSSNDILTWYNIRQMWYND